MVTSTSSNPISISRTSPAKATVSPAISTPISSPPGQINAIAGPSRPTQSRRTTLSPTKSRAPPIIPTLVSKTATVAVAGKVGAGERSELGKRGEGVEKGLSELMIRSDRSPAKGMSTIVASRSAARGEREADGTASPGAKKGWGISLIGGAMDAGVYGAALGVTAYKLWKQSTSQSPDPSLTSSASAPANLASTASVRSSPSPSRDSSILPSIPSIPPITAVGEIAPPPAYRERDRDQADNVDWTDDVDDESIVTPSTSRSTTVRSPSHQHPLLHNTPSRSGGKKRRNRIPSGGLPKRSSVMYGEMTPPLVLPPSPESEDTDTIAPLDQEAVTTVVEGQEEILERLDGMTLRIQRLILEGQAALMRKPEEVNTGGHRIRGSGSWSRRSRASMGGSLRPRGAGDGLKVVKNRRSLPVVGVTVGDQGV